MKLSNRVYDVLKWIALYLLPALGTLYFALAGIWEFPYGEEIVGTITALDTFLGVLLASARRSTTAKTQTDRDRPRPLSLPGAVSFTIIFSQTHTPFTEGLTCFGTCFIL